MYRKGRSGRSFLRRLRGLRETSHLSVDAAARAIGGSRALIYRYEGGDIVKLDTLDRLARLYGTSATALLGLGHEYLTNSVTFFERLEKLESEADQITTVFGPLAFVLTSEEYEEELFRALTRESGTVEIAWAADATNVTLSWKERGGPIVSGAPLSVGFGSNLMREAVERALSGTLRYAWVPEGVEVAIRIPLEKLKV